MFNKNVINPKELKEIFTNKLDVKVSLKRTNVVGDSRRRVGRYTTRGVGRKRSKIDNYQVYNIRVENSDVEKSYLQIVRKEFNYSDLQKNPKRAINSIKSMFLKAYLEASLKKRKKDTLSPNGIWSGQFVKSIYIEEEK